MTGWTDWKMNCQYICTRGLEWLVWNAWVGNTRTSRTVSSEARLNRYVSCTNEFFPILQTNISLNVHLLQIQIVCWQRWSDVKILATINKTINYIIYEAIKICIDFYIVLLYFVKYAIYVEIFQIKTVNLMSSMFGSFPVLIFLHDYNFFFNLHSGGWNQGPLDTAAT
jgi:hypothetical protein